ncbi:protein GL2-INTERACTING REPRESSOR 1 isoform X1 [Ricinus communis]|uniref:GIR1-like zinc ribbon domain-containing protein n=2 Tax=Ricinus communis TaxID=3988 RepID=B9SVZ7_RICCO|nr:protein GL2-INTERACTING REPRESSOR 1 isoform X1 [Ricinus communis]EEF32221.1 conserved hypothetical protein [Ricinus communis]|eukprot:XP_002530166.1 uncharacterized protein LOC8271118 isoform X1 [Ricinus communis]
MALKVQTQQHHHHQYHFVGATVATHGSSLTTLCQPISLTLNLFQYANLSCSYIELEEPFPLPLGWQKFLNLQTGEIYYTKNTRKKTMSRRNGNGPKLDLKLNLSPPRADPRVESPNRSATVSPTSPPSSCVSSELNQDDTLRYSNSPEATSMVLVGCPRCLMYVMLSEDDPKCPKCKSTVLLDFLHENTVQTRNS